jgi:hypothetical protein
MWQTHFIGPSQKSACNYSYVCMLHEGLTDIIQIQAIQTRLRKALQLVIPCVVFCVHLK